MPSAPLQLSTDPSPRRPIVRKGTGTPRFLDDRSRQLDAVLGSPDAAVPKDHLARVVLQMVHRLDTSALESQYSSMGRHGLHPRNKLAVWLYASLTGTHEASRVARAAGTDAAYRLLTGGHSVSATMLCTFRRENHDFLADAISQTVRLAAEAELLKQQELAVDSMRIRADASTKSIRTLARSEERLEELGQVDPRSLDAGALDKHLEKVEKHENAVRRCREEGRTNLSVTNPEAGLMKFPSGAALPGHRVTVVAIGVNLRFVVAVLIGSTATDHNLLRPALEAARAGLARAGVDGKLQAAADAGYLGHDDLEYTIQQRDLVDVLLHDPPEPRRGKSKLKGGYYSKGEFDFQPGGVVLCPAKKPMAGPVKAGGGKIRWRGIGCDKCALKGMCTDTQRREIIVDPERDRLHGAMRDRMSAPGAQQRYRQRIATVEPVFSYIEDTMRFQRSSSRHSPTVRAEILLKILAYNLYRLFFCASNIVAFVEAIFDGRRFATTAITFLDVGQSGPGTPAGDPEAQFLLTL